MIEKLKFDFDPVAQQQNITDKLNEIIDAVNESSCNCKNMTSYMNDEKNTKRQIHCGWTCPVHGRQSI